MRITGSPTVSVQSPAELRPDVSDRLQKGRMRDGNRGQVDNAAIESFRQPEGINREDLPRSVAATNEIDAAFNRRQESQMPQAIQARDEQLPVSTLRALKAFAENTPSPEQQLGIELAGIDVLV